MRRVVGRSHGYDLVEDGRDLDVPVDGQVADLPVGQAMAELGKVLAVDGDLVVVLVAEDDDLEVLARLDAHLALVLLGPPGHALQVVAGDDVVAEAVGQVQGDVVPGIEVRSQLVVDGEEGRVGRGGTLDLHHLTPEEARLDVPDVGDVLLRLGLG